ncbi:MAG: 3-deoxy-D-manno-octulosonic acid transferase [Deltaproteobacteria bacterium]|nr:MAG: 3-deoxy-D-manno-octulosonic acid transferase [Deltaproteobacteria bacterium]
MVYLLYDLILYVSALFLVPYYLYRGVRYGKTRRGIRERLGAYAQDLLLLLEGRQVIWVHAVSVGETRAAIPLLKAVRERYPEALLLLSNVTETGRAIATDVSEIDAYIFFPFDLSWIVRKALKIIRPSIIILVETEIWPNFVLEARRQNIPLVLVNGRISDRSFPRYRMAGRLLEPVLDSISDYCMQSEQDSRRIRHLGAAEGRVRVTGNLKFDMQPPSIDDTNLESLKSELKLSTNACVWVAGSTHDGEETQLVDVYQKLRKVCPDLLLVLVPRHPERCRQVYDELTKAGLIVTLRSTLATMNRALQPGEVMVVDTLGEMLKLYALSDLVFVGGSLVPVGGHNVLEASLMEKPVLFGPYMQNFKEIARLLRAAHGGLQVKDSADLYRQMKLLLENPTEGERIGDNGRHLLQENQGATEKTLMVISRHL